jgi:cytochrome c6
MAAVFVLAEVGEADEPAHEEPAEPAPAEPPPPGGPTPAPPAEPPPPAAPPPSGGAQGDPVAGKEVFLGAGGCGSCHTLSDAGTTGTIGPDLGSLAPSYEATLEQVTNGGGGMPAFKDQLSEEQIQDVAAYVSSATS